LLSDNAWPLRWETNGVLWVGTPAGINRVRSDEVRSITRREGLFDNLAYCLIDDSRGNFWSFGNRGIWKVAQSDMNQVADGLATHVHAVAYGEADGMPSAEGNGDDQPNAVPVANGDLWFPTTHGVVIVNTDRLPSNEVRPSVVIEQVVVDDTVVYRDGFYPMANGVTYPAGGGLRIRPGIGKVVELHYTANTFIAPEGTHFRYRLRGDSTDWREAGTRRQAFYTGLEPGDYLFEVEARNHDGVWSEHPVRFPFRLEPHFYQTWPFYIATGLAAIGLLGTLHTRRLNEARRLQELQQDQALHEERSRIAKDLHDDLGANLTGLALKVEVARRQLDDRSGAEAQLRAAAEAIRSLVERMREVIWSLNPQCDTLESFRAYCCQYAENFLAAAGLRCRFEMPVNVPEVMLSAQERHHLLLVIKEALNNTARHARATEARIGLRYVRGLLVLTLADNGRGFLASASSPLDEGGNGLLNMRRRVESVGGKFELESQIGLGTTIRITVPLPTTR
jgi:signal transduction histidine kinase